MFLLIATTIQPSGFCHCAFFSQMMCMEQEISHHREARIHSSMEGEIIWNNRGKSKDFVNKVFLSDQVYDAWVSVRQINRYLYKCHILKNGVRPYVQNDNKSMTLILHRTIPEMEVWCTEKNWEETGLHLMQMEPKFHETLIYECTAEIMPACSQLGSYYSSEMGSLLFLSINASTYMASRL